MKDGIINEVDYKVFCSEKSVKDLKDASFVNSHSQLELPLAKLNFFTSRFFFAVDIWLDKLCDILVLSDYREALHSLIDPFTESIQIQGRFRKQFPNNRKYNSLTFITNICEDLKVMSEEDVETDIETRIANYEGMSEQMRSAQSDVERKAYEKDLKKLRYNDLLDEDGEIDPNVVHNIYNTERVKEYYLSSQMLKAAYEDTGYFNLHFIDDLKKIAEDDIFKLKQVNRKERWELLVGHLTRLEQFKIDNPEFDLDETMSILSNINQDAEFIIKAYKILGRAPIEDARYQKGKIETALKAVKLKEDKQKMFSPEVLSAVEQEFTLEVETGLPITKKNFRERLKIIFLTMGISFKEYGSGKKSADVVCNLSDKIVEEYFEYTVSNSKEESSFVLKAFKLRTV